MTRQDKLQLMIASSQRSGVLCATATPWHLATSMKPTATPWHLATSMKTNKVGFQMDEFCDSKSLRIQKKYLNREDYR